mmetsp:Transcript_27167/g.38219  ORF Transcript_27167/g.38219 Transcript_27167/m.38219 type:complete len:293 (+) Transcript_27167:132-1010(+)
MVQRYKLNILALWVINLPISFVVSFVLHPQKHYNDPIHFSRFRHRGIDFVGNNFSLPQSIATIRRQMATINFKGTANSEVLVIPPPNIHPSRSLYDFLMASDSSIAVLGTDDTILRSDGLYDCRQPPIGWFGLELHPVFVNKLERNSIGTTNNNYDMNNGDTNGDVICFVTVTIVSARTDIARLEENTSKNRRRSLASSSSSIVSKLMQRCTFMGQSALSHKIAPTGEGWVLSFDFDLTLQIPLPQLLPLPPGFNAIGSRIVRSTCNQRVEQTLLSVRDAYLEWASLPEENE